MKPTTKIYPLIIAATVFTAVCGSDALAQNKTYNEEITVVAPFDPIIPDAFRISHNPVVNDTITAIPAMTYNVVPRIAEVKPAIENLPAVKLVAEPLSKLYRNYVRAGAGNYASLYGELFIGSLRSKQYSASLRLKHQSAAGTIKDYGPPANSHNEAVLDAGRHFGQYMLAGKAYYTRDALHLYGYKPAETGFPVAKDDVRQRYYVAGTKLTLGSNYKSDQRLNHAFGLGFYHMGGLYEAAENNLKATADFDKKFDVLKIGPDQVIGLRLETDFLNRHDSAGRLNSGIFGFNPYMKADINEYSFAAGFKFDLAHDSVTRAYFYPVLEARIELIPNALKLFAGINGSIEHISLQGITSQNAFVSPALPWNFLKDKFKAYGGFQSNISRVFNFNGSITSHTYEDYPFFVTDTASLANNSFTLLYDDMSTVAVKGELEFVKSTKLRLGLTGIYNHYKLSQQPHAWYKPDYQFEFSGRYDFAGKIIVTAKATVNSPVWALKPYRLISGLGLEDPGYAFEPEKLKGWADVSLGGEYRFNNAFSCWLIINNLANSTYYRWYNYRSYGLNAMAGVSYSF